MTQDETNEYRLSLLKNNIFTNAYLPWDQSFLFIAHDNELCIILDGEYCQTDYGVFHNISQEEIESYRIRCNHLFSSLLLNLPARQLKDSSLETTLDLLIIVTNRSSIDNLKKIISREDNYSTSHLFYNLLEEEYPTTRELGVGDGRTIGFHEIINETIRPLEVIQQYNTWWTQPGYGNMEYYAVSGTTTHDTSYKKNIIDQLESLIGDLSLAYKYDYSMEDLLDEVILDWGVVKQPRTFPRTTEFEIDKLPIRAGPGRETDKILNTCMTGL